MVWSVEVNMKRYSFFNWDDYDIDADYDICGKEFFSLIDVCASYSTYFSLDIPECNLKTPEDFRPFWVSVDANEDLKALWYYEYRITNGRHTDLVPKEISERLQVTCAEYAKILEREFSLDFRFASSGGPRYFYKCTHQSIELLKKNIDSLFEYFWKDIHSVPQDLTFYREDFSVLFHTVTHEGEAYLYPKSGEDMSSIIQLGNWHCI